MKEGFTLIELLVVITKMTILSSIRFESFKGAQQKEQHTQQQNSIIR